MCNFSEKATERMKKPHKGETQEEICKESSSRCETGEEVNFCESHGKTLRSGNLADDHLLMHLNYVTSLIPAMNT